MESLRVALAVLAALLAARARRCRSSGAVVVAAVVVLSVACCGGPALPDVVGTYRGDRPGVALDMIELFPSGRYQLTHTKSPLVGVGMFWGGTYRVEGSTLVLLEDPDSRDQIPEQRYGIVRMAPSVRLVPASTNTWPYEAELKLTPGAGWR